MKAIRGGQPYCKLSENNWLENTAGIKETAVKASESSLSVITRSSEMISKMYDAEDVSGWDRRVSMADGRVRWSVSPDLLYHCYLTPVIYIPADHLLIRKTAR